MKTCWKCNEIKYFTEFHRNKSKDSGLHDECKLCVKLRRKRRIAVNPERERKRGREKAKRNRATINAQQRNDRILHPERHFDYYLKKNYRITLEQYNSMLIKQNNVCAICKLPETEIIRTSGKLRKLCVDHDHKTGEVRSLLCMGCNTTLGKIKEDVNIAIAIARYIQKHNNVILDNDGGR